MKELRTVFPLLLLLPLLVACPLLSFTLISAIPIEYQAREVCQGVEVRKLDTTRESMDITLIRSKERDRPDVDTAVRLVTGQRVRIQDPNPAPRSTWYRASTGPEGAGTIIPIDLELFCLPERPSIRVSFNHPNYGTRGVIITEDANEPSGLRYRVADLSGRWIPVTP